MTSIPRTPHPSSASSELSSTPVFLAGGDASTEVTAYSPHAECHYRRLVSRHDAAVLTAARWVHHGTAWIDVHGAMTMITTQALADMLTSDTESTTVVINSTEVTVVERSALAPLHVAFAALRARGVSLDVVDSADDRLEPSAPAPVIRLRPRERMLAMRRRRRRSEHTAGSRELPDLEQGSSYDGVNVLTVLRSILAG